MPWGFPPVLGVSPESRKVLGKALLFLGACSLFVCAGGATTARVTHLQHCRMLLGYIGSC